MQIRYLSCVFIFAECETHGFLKVLLDFLHTFFFFNSLMACVVVVVVCRFRRRRFL